MVLTPQDVHEQQFATVRMRVGYDMDEVDAFLDVVEAEITRLLAENDDLRARLAQAESRTDAPTVIRTGDRPAPPPPPPPAPPRAAEPIRVPAPPAEPVKPAPPAAPPAAPPPPPAAPAAPAAAPPAPPVPAATAAGAGAVAEQSLRMLEMAQKTADETIAGAKKEATDIVAKARTEAAEITSELESRRIVLEKQVGELRTFERQYRTKLRDHIAGQLRELDQRVAVDDGLERPPSLGARGEQQALGAGDPPADPPAAASTDAEPVEGPAAPA